MRSVEMKAAVLRLFHDTEGQDLIEYALLAAFIGLAATAAMSNLDSAITNTFASVSSHLAP